VNVQDGIGAAGHAMNGRMTRSLIPLQGKHVQYRTIPVGTAMLRDLRARSEIADEEGVQSSLRVRG